eukprot:GILJ01006510.1.p1 GENE.GILJ01006510.1~~GILJ01006510.1.p1  ORF type:complete len:186 (+),score=18.46 GILJ01006510.1:49-558(+)
MFRLACLLFMLMAVSTSASAWAVEKGFLRNHDCIASGDANLGQCNPHLGQLNITGNVEDAEALLIYAEDIFGAVVYKINKQLQEVHQEAMSGICERLVQMVSCYQIYPPCVQYEDGSENVPFCMRTLVAAAGFYCDGNPVVLSTLKGLFSDVFVESEQCVDNIPTLLSL